MAIKARIEVDNTELKKGLKDAEKQAKTSMDKISDAAQSASGGFRGMLGYLNKLGPVAKIAAAGIAIIGTAVAAAAAGIKKLTDKFDSISKEASGLDITTDELQTLQFAAARSNIPFEKLSRIMIQTNENLKRIKDGSLKTAKAFAELGISTKDLELQTPFERLLTVIEAVRRYQGEGSPDSALFELYNKKQVKDIKQMAANNFDLVADSMGFMGLTIDGETIQSAVELKDAFTGVNMALIKSLSDLINMKNIMKEVNELALDFQNRFNNYGTAGRLPTNAKKVGIGNAIDLFEDSLKNDELSKYGVVNPKLIQLQEKEKARARELLIKKFGHNRYLFKNDGSVDLDYVKRTSIDNQREIYNILGRARLETFAPEILKSEKYGNLFKNFNINDPTTWIADKPKDWNETTQKAKNDLADTTAVEYIKEYGKEVEKIKSNAAQIRRRSI